MGQQDIITNAALRGNIVTDQKAGQILAYPSTSGSGYPNVMLGNFVGPGGVPSPDIVYNGGGMRVAKPGFDVRTASDDQLIFNSDRNVLKVIKSGVASINLVNTGGIVAAGTQFCVVPTGLDFIPAFLTYQYVETASTSAYFQIPYQQLTNVTIGAGTYGAVSLSIIASIDGPPFNELYFTIRHYSNFDYGSNTTLRFKYFLLQETANTADA